MWSTYQIIKTISFTTGVAFPEPFSQFLWLIEFIQLDFLGMISASCVYEELGIYSNHVLVTSLVPVGVAVLIILIYLGRVALIGRGTPEKDAALSPLVPTVGTCVTLPEPAFHGVAAPLPGSGQAAADGRAAASPAARTSPRSLVGIGRQQLQRIQRRARNAASDWKDDGGAGGGDLLA